MRPVALFSSIVVFIAAPAAAVALAMMRYADAARHEIILALLLTIPASAAAAFAAQAILPRAHAAVRIIFYIGLTGLMICAIATHCIGIDGILPRRDGSQNTGLAALTANIDLFGSIVIGTAFACRRCLFSSAVASYRSRSRPS